MDIGTFGKGKGKQSKGKGQARKARTTTGQEQGQGQEQVFDGMTEMRKARTSLERLLEQRWQQCLLERKTQEECDGCSQS